MSDETNPQPASTGVNENFFAWLFVALACGFLILLCRNPAIELAAGELVGQRLLRLVLFTAYWCPLVYFIGGRKFNVTEWLKAYPVPFAIILAAIIHGASQVLGK